MGRTTSNDVAQLAGVSRATVSYVLNDTPGQKIPDETRERVRQAASELGYVPHAAARALRAGNSNLVLFITRQFPFGVNISALTDRLTDNVALLGKSLVSWQESGGQTLSTVLSNLDPCLAITMGGVTARQHQVLASTRVPVIDVGEVVQLDPFGLTAGQLQVQHLASKGHHRLGYIGTGDARLDLFAEPRLRGVQQACMELGLPQPPVDRVTLPDEDAVDHLADVLRTWRAAHDPVTAVACYNDLHAGVVLQAARRVGLAVPGDLAVMGVDDEPMAAYTDPPLTTVKLDVAAIAEGVLVRARAILQGETPPRTTSSTQLDLIERASV